MDTAKKLTLKKSAQRLQASSISLALLSILSPVYAGEANIKPYVNLEEVYSDNVSLDEIQEDNSLVSLLSSGVDIEYLSSKIDLNLSYEKTFAYYSHNHDLDDNYDNLNLNSRFKLYPNGLSLIANSSISNVSQSLSRNALADLVSADTTEERQFQIGLEYINTNSDFLINSQYMYSKSRSDDDIGERDGYSVFLNSKNGNGARYVFWDLNSNYQDYDNNGRTRTGRYYSVDAIVGYITHYKVNPFIRYYDEGNSGNINQNSSLDTSSIGAGLQWHLSRNSYAEIAYNWADDEDDNITDEDIDDYVSVSLYWRPSSRTNLTAKYYQRFFGDAYELQYSHRLKRLTTNIQYTESVELFDRYEYTEGDPQQLWCLTASPQDLNQCLFNPNSSRDLSAYYLVDEIRELTPVESNDFILNKSFNTTLEYNAKRTIYTLSINKRRRENLELNDYDTYEVASFNMNRKMSRTTSLAFNFSWNRNEFDHDNLQTSIQYDYYRSYRLTYKKTLNEAFNISTSYQFLNRDSNRVNQTYEESRFSLQLTKEF